MAVVQPINVEVEVTAKNVHRLTVGPNDGLMIELPPDTEWQDARAVYEAVKREWPGIPCLIFAGDIQVSVVEITPAVEEEEPDRD